MTESGKLKWFHKLGLKPTSKHKKIDPGKRTPDSDSAWSNYSRTYSRFLVFFCLTDCVINDCGYISGQPYPDTFNIEC
jgi:hypothetical protein